MESKDSKASVPGRGYPFINDTNRKMHDECGQMIATVRAKYGTNGAPIVVALFDARMQLRLNDLRERNRRGVEVKRDDVEWDDELPKL